MWKTESGHYTTLPALQVDQNSTWKDRPIYRPSGTVLCYAVSFKAAGKKKEDTTLSFSKWKSNITAAEKHAIKPPETVSPIFSLSIIYLSVRIILVHFHFYFHFGRFEYISLVGNELWNPPHPTELWHVVQPAEQFDIIWTPVGLILTRAK